MSCGCNNNGGWGGCGCGNTVQYAPSACNPNFPTTCNSLGDGNIVRVVGENSAGCKYTVKTPATNSLLTYNAGTTNVGWNDGSSTNPIYLSPSTTSQTSGNLLGISALSGNAGQLVEVFPSTPVTEATFPIVPTGGSTTNWGTIENLVPNTGLVYRNSSNKVAQLSTTVAGQVVSFDTSGNPTIVPASSFTTSTAFIDANSISIQPYGLFGQNNLGIQFGQLVVTNSTNNQVIINGSGNIYNCSILASGVGGLDAGSGAANTTYFIYVIYGSSVGINVLFSLYGTAPTLPTNYTYSRLIGVTRTVSNSVTFDGNYNQNGRVVNFGYTAREQVLYYTGATNKYFTGAVSYGLSSSYASTARFKLSSQNTNSQTYNYANVIIGSVSSGTTGTTNTAYPNTAEVFGAASYQPIPTEANPSPNFVTFDAFMPQSFTGTQPTYYNLLLDYAPNGGTNFVELAITGYQLNIF
jgi:hypothetical protein